MDTKGRGAPGRFLTARGTKEGRPPVELDEVALEVEATGPESVEGAGLPGTDSSPNREEGMRV